MSDLENRRPLKVRSAGFAKKIASWLCQKNITPNQISILSVFFALLAAICLYLIPTTDNLIKKILPVLAAVFIQFRLLCNLFDGMVAVEGGKGTPAGELFNDIPDRVADSLLMIATGYAVVHLNYGFILGWSAALLSVFTAYIRTLSASIGAPVNFQGPMAKQHRMATLTIACILSAFESFFWNPGIILWMALVIIVIGCLITIARRAYSAYNFLENK